MRQGCVCLTHCCVFRSLPTASTKYVFCHHLLDEWIHLLINLWQAYCSVCVCMHAKLLQSCLTLCDSMDYSLPGSSVCGLQARILEWIAMPFSRGSYQSRDQTCVSYIPCIGRQVLFHQCHLGSPSVWWRWKCESLSHMQLFVTPWAVAHQARQEYWSGLPFPSSVGHWDVKRKDGVPVLE